MMFVMHLAFSLALITLAFGVCLYIWSLQNKGPGNVVAKFFGVAIIVLTILGMLCTWYYGVKYWSEGYFKQPMPMMHMQGKSMMDGMEMSGDMMQNGSMMKGKVMPDTSSPHNKQ